ncbi:efflux transporter outer membrane subunit [Duganella sp. FT135W]|uniref:Efflux transporter outer membrane subunit n=1 Tax=Duganella flavida TaxID=2692175 RepID=A0A6L8KJV1_9BURK|nr:efflux transporter outer membrane subunit [Duganella flavida]MYM26084.1 efflux transporter outer membrane subunit [Duganella flavida]
MAASLAALLSGCAAGPDYIRPTVPVSASGAALDRYTAEPLADVADQRYTVGQDVSSRWWTLFGSDELNALVDAALAANPDLQAAEAGLRAARETAAAQRGALMPSVDLHLQPTRQKFADPVATSASSGANLYSLHTAQLNIAYSPDVFGGTRRTLEAADAQTDVVRFQRDAARLTLTSNLVLAAITEASLHAQLDATRTLVDNARKQLDAVRKQQRAGQLGAADVAAQEALLAQTEATLPPLEKQMAQQRDLLAVLAGRLPSDGVTQHMTYATLRLPEQLPLSVPAQLLEQRPDIRASEAQLHAASAQVGVARAARLPNINLTSTLGSSALSAGTLFSAGTGFWSIGADLVQPLFHGGALKHQQLAAEASYDQAAAQYRGVVLSAFQNVADTLYAIEADSRALRALTAAEQAAGRSLTIAQKQRQAGAIGQPAVLQAELAYQQAVLARIQAEAARYADTVALFQALGGGWSKAEG